ncbi:hypothetical protein CVT26_014799 [Gymnopilus dilepis]|uniref:Uncharacterized protein n=1 Tax=Gymnopilus dilepis TaxID=231916 RepID=A0A409W3S6_9AGAR|nr:hypothetical protein CVT26_014799 [Gymnopilus dilepis]
MSHALPPDSVQEALVDINVEVTLLGNLLFVNKGQAQQRVIIWIVSLSYLVYIVNAAIDWYIFKWTTVDNGQTRATVFVAAYDESPGWFKLSNDICSFLMAGLADTLLIWRCFNIWDRSPYPILFPSFLLFSETVIILVSSVRLHPTAKQGALLNNLIAASFFITCATTLITTILISYRIYSMSRSILPKNSRMRFDHIVDILIQSAAVYTLSAIAFAIPAIFPDSDSNLTGLQAARMYRWTIFNFTAGAAPTIMVARVILSPPPKAGVSTVSNLSTIQFHDQSTFEGAGHSEQEDIEQFSKDASS